MIKVDIRNLPSVQRRLSKIGEDLRGKAAQMAVNKTAPKAKTEIKRAVSAEFAISQAEVAGSVFINQSKLAKTGKVEAIIDIFGSPTRRGRSMNVVRFMERSITMAQAKKRARQNKLYGIGTGGRLLPILGFKFKRRGGIKHIDGSFIGNKGRTVFMRTGKSRLPVKPVQMIGVSQMFTTDRIKRRILNKINYYLIIEVGRAVELVISKNSK